MLVGDEDREPVVEITEHRQVVRCADEEPNDVVVQRCGVSVRAIGVVILHLIFFRLFIYLAVWWPGRGAVNPEEVPASAYGRPLVK